VIAGGPRARGARVRRDPRRAVQVPGLGQRHQRGPRDSRSPSWPRASRRSCCPPWSASGACCSRGQCCAARAAGLGA
jgi:hypothetical protein